MNVNVFFTAPNFDETYFKGKTTVVIDVLRATTTIVTALCNGALSVIPVDSIELAKEIMAGSNKEFVVTGGEKDTQRIDGFDFGNSPLEYTAEIVKGKKLLLFTTNGTKAIVKTRLSSKLLISSFLNFEAVAKNLCGNGGSFEIVCSGGNGLFCIEDSLCAGKIIEEVVKTFPNIQMNDAAKASYQLALLAGANIYGALKECEHGKKLINNGFQKDVLYCSNINTMNVVPEFSENIIKLLSEEN